MNSIKNIYENFFSQPGRIKSLEKRRKYLDKIKEGIRYVLIIYCEEETFIWG